MSKSKTLVWAAAALAASLSGCASMGGGGGGGGSASTASLQASPTQPAAEGAVKFGVAKNDNTSVNLSVKHLAKPEKLQPSESAYVVWTKRDANAEPQNIGALQVDKNLTGTLNTVTPLHQFEIFVTAEPNGQAQQPSGDRQLWTSFSR